jgi:hypothetical protein
MSNRDETPGTDHRHRSRTPLNVLDDGNGGTPGHDMEMLKVVKGKGRRPVSVEVPADGKGRTTWGSLKAVAGRGTWREREDSVGKMFI